jgi:hypothetical protein
MRGSPKRSSKSPTAMDEVIEDEEECEPLPEMGALATLI